MKYANAAEILPREILSAIQKYYQGGYLYVPMETARRTSPKTSYRIELEKRNQQIYLKHLEGRTNGQLVQLYHLSVPSIRRILSGEKVRYQDMKETIEQVLPFWGIQGGQARQIYPSAWEINGFGVLKVYHDKNQPERNITISSILLDCGIPAAEILPTATGENYLCHQDIYFLLTKKLPGSNILDIREEKMALKMGRAIARLHQAFLKCEEELTFWDNSLLLELKGWIQETLAGDGWNLIKEAEYAATAEKLEAVYDRLPRQPIHRDVHFGNFLFWEGKFSGYIDFDLSQKNIRIFDLCYFLAGLLAEETEQPLTKTEWIANIRSAVTGYEEVTALSAEEKASLPQVMESIEILFAAYFLRMKDTKQAESACELFRFIRSCESDILKAL